MYHVRIRVPADAQPLLRRTELHCSLGTRNRREAEQRARPLITRMRAQIFKARAKVSGDTYRAEILSAQAESLGTFDAIDGHFEQHYPAHTIEQLQAFIAQLTQPTLNPPSEPARTVLTSLSDLTPLTAILDHNENVDLGAEAIRQRSRSFADFMAHQHAEGRYYLDHVTIEHWQDWCRALFDGDNKRATVKLKQSCARAAIKDFLIDNGKTYDPARWTSVVVGKTSRTELEERRDANSPLTLSRWQELYDAHLSHNLLDEADIWALGLLTGARINEIIHMHASQLDLTLNEWRIPISKTLAGIRMIPLTPMALDIIEARLTASPDGYLFARGINEDRSYRNWYNKCGRARAKIGAVPHVETQHSTRSTFRTLAPRMAPASTPAGVIEAIMGHEISGGIASATKHYLRAFEPDAHTFMAHWRPAITLRSRRA